MIPELTFSICRNGSQFYLYHFDVEKSSFVLLGIFNSYIKCEDTYAFYNRDSVMIVFSKRRTYLTFPATTHIVEIEDDKVFFEENQILHQLSDEGKITPLAKSASDTFRIWKNDKYVYFVSYIFKKVALTDFSVDEEGNVQIKNNPFRGYILKRNEN